MLKCFLLFFPMLLFSWEEYKTIEKITIYKKYDSKFDFVQFKAKTNIPASMDEITKVITNLQTYKQWLSDCIKAEHANDNIYILMQPPWPLTQRQVLAKLKIRRYPYKKTIILSSVNNQTPTPNAIWFTYLYAEFNLEPIDATHTKVTLSLLGDPGGFPPSWMVNLMAWEIPYKSLRDLNKLLQQRSL